MKLIIYFLTLLFTLCAKAQQPEMQMLGFEKINEVATVKVRVMYPTGQKVLALWRSDDMVTWKRVELEYGQSSLVRLDVGNTYCDYYVTEGKRSFFKVAPYLPTQYLFIRNIVQGMSGDDVSNLQTFLQELGYLSWTRSMEKGYFGPMTKQALAADQVANGVVDNGIGTEEPDYGYFGPLTRALVNLHTAGQ